MLTTSHKHNYTLEQWNDIFKERGIDVQIDRLGGNISNLNRKDEILNWVENSGCEDFVIIDDDKSLNDLPFSLKERLILTSPMIGLTYDKAIQAISILMK